MATHNPTLNDKIFGSVAKKEALLKTNFLRYFTRCILAGVYLTLGTAFSAHVGQKVENLAPGLGSVTFAMFFFVGLATIVILNAELVTSNMMYMSYGVVGKKIPWRKAALMLIVCVIGNLVGAVIIGYLLGQSAAYSGLTPESFVSVTLDHKLEKHSMGLFVEAMLANFVVNMAIVGCALIKDIAGKLIWLMFVIGMFVDLGLEHVVANFSLVTLVGFGSEVHSEYFTAGYILHNWGIDFFGNLVGGGLCIGGVYAWLNRGSENYRD